MTSGVSAFVVVVCKAGIRGFESRRHLSSAMAERFPGREAVGPTARRSFTAPYGRNDGPMPRVCFVCAHPERAAIDEVLIRGQPRMAGARRFAVSDDFVDRPDLLWATDATEGWSERDGRCAVFVIVDHGSGELFFDAAERMDRFAAADLLREVTTERFASVEAAVAAGLALRYDGGSCFRSAHYHAEIDHLGIARPPAFHYEPETNGCAERAIQTLKEQVLWIGRFETLEELRAAVRSFGRLYNREWLLDRHGYRTPIEARELMLAGAMA